LESAYAFELAGAVPEPVHINRLLENPAILSQYQILCLPGGFSYGDDIAAGRILGVQIERQLAGALAEFKDHEKLILGICNGFQVLIRCGILLAGDAHGAPATLTGNDSGRFEDRWVHLNVTPGRSVFLAGIERMELPVAHAEGKFVARSGAVLAALDQAGQLVLRYGVPPEGKVDRPGSARLVHYPANPNGSEGNVAGCSDVTGRVLGLMPHPERHVDPTHHPRWTRGEGSETGDGLAVFQNAVRYFA
jgi:phosphoribosylformylglycinamidine synthase